MEIAIEWAAKLADKSVVFILLVALAIACIGLWNRINKVDQLNEQHKKDFSQLAEKVISAMNENTEAQKAQAKAAETNARLSEEGRRSTDGVRELLQLILVQGKTPREPS